MEVYVVDVTVYQDTRMGASNPSYRHLVPYSSLETCKKGIIKDLKDRRKRHGWDKNFPVPDFEIKLKGGKWSMDFNPEIVTVTKVKVE